MLIQNVHLNFVFDAEIWRSRLVGNQIYLLDFTQNCQLVWGVEAEESGSPATRL